MTVNTDRITEDRAAWKYLLDASREKTVLSYGCAFTGTSLALARTFGRVVSVDADAERLAHLKHWADKLGLDNIDVVRGGAAAGLPFPADCFDAVALDGALDSVAGPLALLQEVRRTLKPGGECYVGAGNRFGYETLFKATEPSTHRLSYLGYRSLLRRAGFETLRFYAPHPDIARFSHLRGLSGSGRTSSARMSAKNAVGRSARLSPRLLKCFAPSFSIVASGSPESEPLVERLVRNALQKIDGDGGDWVVEHFAVSSGKVFVQLGSHAVSNTDAYPFIVKIPMTPYAGRRLLRNVEALDALHDRPAGMRRRAPRNLASGRLEGESYFVEQRIPGVVAETAASDRSRRETLLKSAQRILTEFHQATSDPVTLDDGLFHDLFAGPLEEVAEFLGQDPDGEPVQSVTTYLKKMALGRQLPRVWSHGDFSLKNLLVDEDSLAMRGVIDWDLSNRAGLPLIDLLHLLVRTKMVETGRSFPEALFEHLFPVRFDGLERELLDDYIDALSLDSSLVPSLSVMYWLSRIHGHVGSHKNHDADWVNQNYTSCLHELVRRM